MSALDRNPKRLGGDLIASARGDAPSAAARARVAGALGLGIGAASAAATTNAAAAAVATTASAVGAGATNAAKIAGFGVWTKVVGVAALTLAIGGGAVVATHADAPATTRLAAPALSPSELEAKIARAHRDEIPRPEPLEREPVEAESAAVAPVASQRAGAAGAASAAAAHVATKSPARDSEPSALTREVRAIDAARSALAAGDSRRALTTLDRHDRDFPSGPMRTEADVLRVDALVAAHDDDAAKRLASQLLARDPSSPHAKHLRSVVGSTEK